ncbi:MAG: hypothetical protein KY456_13845 [Chloroflexi bacterium]|nr:hypothetical protein [Chloroflexota bacterium]
MTDDAESAPARASTEQAPPEPVDEAFVESAPTAGIRRRYLAAFGVTVAVVIIVLALLPTALVSMYHELRGQVVDHVYDLFSGMEVDVDRTFAPDTAFANITVTNLDESSRIATLTVSGHRVCEAICPPTTVTFFSLGNDAAQRRGLPPSAAVTVPGESGTYTNTIELPIRGTPQLYPFDNYTLLLGLVFSVTLPTGREEVIISPELVRERVALTLEDQVVRLNMFPPVPVDPATVHSPSDPVDFLLVDRLEWQRPGYLRILTVLLVILISASGIFALGLRSLHELVLGIGGIILGIWGVRSVVVQSELPDVTLIDVILGFVILVLLLALSLRAARYFFVQSGLRR